MKQAKATASMLTRYLNQYGEPLKCSRCSREAQKDEKLFRNSSYERHPRYYCQSCASGLFYEKNKKL